MTIAAGVLAMPVALLYPNCVGHLLMIAAWAGFGILMPCAVWLITGQRIRKRRHRTDLSTLPAAAVGEELLWRVTAPLLLTHWGLSNYAAVATSAAGFIALHYPKNKRMAFFLYICLFTTFSWAAILSGAVFAAIVFHVAHNFALAFLKPGNGTIMATQPPPPSRNVW
ncbi:CPBP family intramembrane glutamic endopeptidase [Actinomyces wuliandei]|uniref:CPBP family intramembrane glutamic endopeptidase n=1 Tax=Actinomyces wuliandei TaxID=2057743 RepID=UPI0013E30025|nr:CPBP family intramembrane glutamic endopeptidase [Actinomyces wuliandei]